MKAEAARRAPVPEFHARQLGAAGRRWEPGFSIALKVTGEEGGKSVNVKVGLQLLTCPCQSRVVAS